jgi:T5SS/PEP-CTERM-associated repeat protein
LTVGSHGSGTLTITNGGQVSSGYTYVGDLSGSTGTVTVDGANSKWTYGVLTLGGVGSGMLTITNGGQASSDGGACVGAQSGSTGTVTVDGANSKWTNGNLQLGLLGSGTLTITNGGQVANSNGVVARASGSTGTVTVEGGGSTWTSSALYLGGSDTAAGGTGVLNVNTGGTVNVTNTLKIWSGGTVNLNGGTIQSGSLDRVGTFSWTAGTLRLTNQSPIIETAANPFGDTLSVSAGKVFQISQHLTVGETSGGTLTISSGGQVSNSNAYVGRNSGSTGAVTVDGSGSTWTSSAVYLGGSDTAAGGTGVLNVNTGATVDIANTLKIWSGGTVNLNGGTIQTGSLDKVGTFSWTAGTLRLTNQSPIIETGANPFGASLSVAAAKIFQISQDLTVGGTTGGTLTISNGGQVSNSNAYVGRNSGSTGTVTVDGSGSTWTSSALYLAGSDTAAGGTGVLNVNPGGAVNVSNTLKIWSGGSLNLNGGTANLGTLTRDGGGRINFTRGSLSYTGDLTVGTGGLLGDSDLNLSSAQNLTLTGTTTINPFWTLNLSGGTFNTGILAVNGAFNFTGGTLRITGSGGLAIGPGGPLGSTCTLLAARHLNVSNAATVDAAGRLILQDGSFSAGTLTNNGEVRLQSAASTLTAGTLSNNKLIAGSGQINAPLTNNAAGVVSAATGERLNFAGSGSSNHGQLELLGGVLSFTGDLTNASDGFVVGNGSLTMQGGWHNAGTAAFSATTNVRGTVTNDSGGLVVSSGGTTTFYDNVVNNGTIRTSQGSFSVFFGTLSGSGTFTGLGTALVEGNLHPGNSPATVNFDGDLQFGSGAGLNIELGGRMPGSGYDQVRVAHALGLSGTLDVTLINSFQPAHNDTFNILHFASKSGDFAVTNGLDLGNRLRLVPEYTANDLTLTAVQGGSGTWQGNNNANASAPANWGDGSPNGVGDRATFGSGITTSQTVSIDAPLTLGAIQFDNTYAYTLGGANPSTLTLQAAGTSHATIDVTSAGSDGHVISAPVVLASPLDISTVTTGKLTFAGPLQDSGAYAITKTGTGSLILAGRQDYAPGTVLQFGSAGGGSPEIAGSHGAAPLPEPATLVLLVAGGLCLLVCAWRRGKVW